MAYPVSAIRGETVIKGTDKTASTEMLALATEVEEIPDMVIPLNPNQPDRRDAGAFTARASRRTANDPTRDLTARSLRSCTNGCGGRR